MQLSDKENLDYVLQVTNLDSVQLHSFRENAVWHLENRIFRENIVWFQENAIWPCENSIFLKHAV